MVKTRQEISDQDKWLVEELYSNIQEWEEDFQSITKGKKTPPYWPETELFKNELGEGAGKLKSALELYLNTARKLEKIYTYAHLKYDEDLSSDLYKSAYNKSMASLHQFQHEFSWLEPGILMLPEECLTGYLKSPELKDYLFYIEKLLNVKDHTLSPEQEALIALSGQALSTSYKAFGSFNNADTKFKSVKDSKNKKHELTHASYSAHLRSTDRELRKNAFTTIHGHFSDYENTLCELISGTVHSHIFNARARSYSTTLEAALQPKNIDTSVYTSLIATVRKELPALHRYVALRKKILGLKELHLYDLYVPLVPKCDIKMNYDEAEELIIGSASPLGTEYSAMLSHGLKRERWVDRYENKNKRSGAYSSGCYDSAPYILMNYDGKITDVFTLAHEAGHSMHSLLSRTNQPYHYADYPIFVAEVASTFNEELLSRHMIAQAFQKEEKIFLINQKIEDIRTTFFRQAMFAEFELLIHELLEKYVPLTPSLLREEYKKLNEAYFGPDVIIDDEISIEWARIPHFYYNYYVYQYSTGMSAALFLAQKVVDGGDKELSAYLSFLQGGFSRYPLELLANAGVDMTKPDAIKATIARFSSLVDELEKEMIN